MLGRLAVPKGWIRGLLLLLGLSSVVWSAPLIPQFSAAAPLKGVTARIVADERFRGSVLEGVLTSIQGISECCVWRSDLSRSKALILLSVAEERALRRSSDEANHAALSADEGLRSALSLNPSDSFLWMLLYSLEVTRNGFDATSTTILGQSYATGPREMWIALRRNRMALATFSLLNNSLQESVVNEFVSMVGSDLTEEAAANLLGVGWSYREILLAGLRSTDTTSREALARRLAREGAKISVPGIDLGDRQWWQP
ncbi:hypothetical protein ACVWZZ_006307 [Bradyrhizobium sp. LM6.10]